MVHAGFAMVHIKSDNVALDRMSELNDNLAPSTSSVIARIFREISFVCHHLKTTFNV